MTVFWYQEIIDSCPLLYRLVKHFECEPGWEKILRCLSLKLESLIANSEEVWVDECCAVQVKEKYGTLCFYMSTATDEMYKHIEDAEALCEVTCEVCGDFGEFSEKCHWYQTLCKACREKRGYSVVRPRFS